jgi:hypothetical protein
VPNAQKRPKSHHVLPQFYLRAWASYEGKIGARLRNGKTFETGAEALAVEKDFYTAEQPDGTKDASVEKALAEVDAMGAAVHATLLRREFPVGPEQKASFSQWLGLQWVRGRNTRTSGHELADKLQKMIIRIGLENAAMDRPASTKPTQQAVPRSTLDGSEGVPIPDFSDLSKAERDQMERELDDVWFEVPREAMLLQMLTMMFSVAVPFQEAEWHLLAFGGPLLFTSDEPIILQRDWRPENQFLGVGPATADQMYVPISPSLCLAVVRTGGVGRESIHDLPDDEAEKINQQTVNTLWSQLFRHPDGPAFPDDVRPLPDERIVVN